MVRMAAVHTPRLIGAMAFLSFLPGPHHEDPDDGGQDADGRDGDGEDHRLGRRRPPRPMELKAVTPRMMAAMMVMT